MVSVSPSILRNLITVVLAGVVSACGGGGGSSPSPAPTPNPPVVPVPPATYLLGGTVTGLADGAVVSISNGADTISVNANGGFSLPTRLPAGATYNVTSTNPSGHVCSVSEGAGAVAAADIAKVVVKCTAFRLAGKDRPIATAYAVAVDATGDMYVLNTDEQVIFRVTTAGVVSAFAGNRNVRGHEDGAGQSASFYTKTTSRMAFDPQGNLILADTCNGLLRKITPGGVVSTLAGRLQTHCAVTADTHIPDVDGIGANVVFGRLENIAIDKAGNIIVSEQFGNALRRITPAGVVSSENPFPAGGLVNQFIAALTFGADGNLYIADSSGSTPRLSKVTNGVAVTIGGSSSATVLTTDTPALGARFNKIAGMVADGLGNIYIADDYLVRKLNPQGILSLVAGRLDTVQTQDGTAQGAAFSNLASIAVSPQGGVVVLEAATSQLRMVSSAGIVTTAIATPAYIPYADGKGSAASFGGKSYLASGPDSALYVVDTANHVVRKISTDGTVSLFAGIPGKSGSGSGPVTSATLSSPIALAVDSSGALFVGDSTGIRKIAGGEISAPLPGFQNFRASPQMRVLPDGGFVFAGSDGVAIYSSSGQYRGAVTAISSASLFGVESYNNFLDIRAIEVDAAGNIYIASGGHAVILKYSADGKLSIFAGTLNNERSIDGPVGTGAFTFESMGDMAIDVAGNLYLSGQGNIRKINPQGIVSTPTLAWGRPNVLGITVRNGMLFGSTNAAILQTPLP